MKIGIVGGTGNISRAIVKKLLEEGHEVYCFNRGIKGKIPKGAHLIIGDRNNEKSFEKLMQNHAFDFAIDMICMNSNQAMSSIRAFKFVKHLIVCSSISTYGYKHNLYPVKEDQELSPISAYGKNKAEADRIFLDSFKEKKFPVTIVKLSQTYGPEMGLLRQVSSDFSWIDRIREGKPILVCDDGSARCQFMHIKDTALAFSILIGKKKCIGEVYNLVAKKNYTWKEYHQLAMKVIGRDVDMVEVPFDYLKKFKIPGFKLCREVFSHDLYFSSEKFLKTFPEFLPQISLKEGMREVINQMDQDGRIKNHFPQNWEDRIIDIKKKGNIEDSVLINSLLFNLDRIIYFIKRKLLKLSKI